MSESLVTRRLAIATKGAKHALDLTESVVLATANVASLARALAVAAPLDTNLADLYDRARAAADVAQALADAARFGVCDLSGIASALGQ